MESKSVFLTKAFRHGSTRIAILQSGDEFKIVKKVINYVRGKNVDSWRVVGSASTFSTLGDCVTKFSAMVNKTRKEEGKEPLNFTVE